MSFTDQKVRVFTKEGAEPGCCRGYELAESYIGERYSKRG